MPRNTHKTGASLYYVNPTQYLAQINNMPAYSASTQDAWRTAFDSLFTSTDFGSIGELAISYTQDNEEKIYSMNCTNNLFLNTSDKKSNITGVMLENANIDVISTLLGADRQSLTGTSTNVTSEAKGTGWTIGQPIKVNFKNANNTAVSSLIVRNGGTTLTLNTDYRVYVANGTNGDNGFTYVVPLTAQALAITFAYSYTPSSAEFMGVETRNKANPITAYKIISCPYLDDTDTVTPWRRMYVWATSCSLTGELAMQFFKQGDSFEGVSFEIQSDGGVVVTEIRKGATQVSV